MQKDLGPSTTYSFSLQSSMSESSYKVRMNKIIPTRPVPTKQKGGLTSDIRAAAIAPTNPPTDMHCHEKDYNSSDPSLGKRRA